ncbi:NADH-quinone oxidoreductase subunit K [Staphylococcus aureus]
MFSLIISLIGIAVFFYATQYLSSRKDNLPRFYFYLTLFMFAIGTYMILSINLIRIVIGISIYTHAGNLIIMSMGTYGSSRSEPLITGGNQLFVDPLLQAIVLTAIVIGFGMTAFLLVLVYRTYKVTKEDEIEGLRGEDDAK